MLTPKPHQVEGAEWLAVRRRALLADTPRVGKTGTTILATDLLNATSVLVVCPGIARENWAREFARFSLLGLPVSVVMAADDPIEPNGITILSMDGSRNADIHARVMQHQWDVLVVDEAQFLKDPGSQRTRQVLSRHGFAAKADYIWFLTGTPLLNHPGELWVMTRTLGIFSGSYVDFLDRFTVWFPGDYGPVIKATKNVEQLKAMLAPVMLRRTWRELFPDTPEPIWLDVELDPAHALPEHFDEFAAFERKDGARLRALVDKILDGRDLDIGAAQGGFVKLRSATSYAKATPTAAWARRQLDAGVDKMVVFAHHSWLLEYLTTQLADFGAGLIYGPTPMHERQGIIDRFNAADLRCRVLLLQHQVGRTAIDLSRASHLLFAELDWVPENNVQAAMRVQGPRQTRPVTIYAAHLANSSDAALARVLRKKAHMASALFA